MRIDSVRPLNPGTMRERITWQRKVVSGQDDVGADVYEWKDVATCRVRVDELAGSELDAARQWWAQAKYQITQQYVDGVERSDRIMWGTSYLDVLDIQVRRGANRYQVVIAKDYVS